MTRLSPDVLLAADEPGCLAAKALLTFKCPAEPFTGNMDLLHTIRIGATTEELAKLLQNVPVLRVISGTLIGPARCLPYVDRYKVALVQIRLAI